MIKKGLFFFSFIFFNPSFASVEDYFNQIKTNPNTLYIFLKEMPKGGELHYHLTGGVYPEAMLKIAEEKNYCINPTDYAISSRDTICKGMNTRDLKKFPKFYENTIKAWSLKDFHSMSETAHDHFFNSFYKFSPLASDNHLSLLVDILKRAASQNELYLELMILTHAPKTYPLSKPIEPQNFEALRQALLANAQFKADLEKAIKDTDALIPASRKALGCEQKSQAVCDLVFRFQYYVLRERPLASVFSQAVFAFEAAKKSKSILGVNIVQQEDGMIALEDYQRHMAIFSYLHKIYPGVHIALHAGELAPESVSPENLRFHIQSAVHEGAAERIGHGTSITYENNAKALLDYLKINQIAVEINLTSNEKILNQKGKKHPLTLYLSHQVPVVLSTDDEGVLRTELTREYVKAVVEHQLTYSDLKEISRAALRFSFLPGNSLWLKGKKEERIKECTDLMSLSCMNFVNKSEKAALERILELKFLAFEDKF